MAKSLYRNKRILNGAQEAPCQNCGNCNGTTVAAHSNQLRDGKGTGIKAHDYRVAYLCDRCHYEIDQGKGLSKEERQLMWEEAHRKTIGYIFENDIVK